MNSPLRIVVQLFDLLEKDGIRYCLWKSNQHLAEALTGKTDMDLLLEQSRAGHIERVLTELGYKRFISQPWARYPGIEDWIGFDNETGKLVHVHLHYQLVLGRKFVKEHHLPWEEFVLNSAIKDPTFNVLITDPNLEIILLGIRIGLKTTIPSVSISQRSWSLNKDLWIEFSYLFERIDESTVKKYANDLFGITYGQQFGSIITHEDLRKPEVILKIKGIINKVLAKHRRYSLVRTWGISVFRMLQSLLAKASRKLGMNSQTGKQFPHQGAIIAIIGCDGSGKSTISSELVQWLAWKIDARKIYLGSGDGSVGLPVRLLKSLTSPSVRKMASRQTIETDFSKKDGNRRFSLLKEVGSCLLDLSITSERHRKVKEAYQARTKGCILITDRYPQNQFVGIYDGPRVFRENSKSWIRKFFTRLEERKYKEIANLSPDVVVKLHIPVEVALQRKPGHNADNIRRKAAITGELRFTGAKIVDMDASKPLTDVLKAVKKVVWESL